MTDPYPRDVACAKEAWNMLHPNGLIQDDSATLRPIILAARLSRERALGTAKEREEAMTNAGALARLERYLNPVGVGIAILDEEDLRAALALIAEARTVLEPFARVGRSLMEFGPPSGSSADADFRAAVVLADKINEASE